MDIVSIIIGAVVGGILAFFGAKSVVGKGNDARVKDLNSQADKTLAEARSSAARITDEAKRKADGIVSKAEKKNEEVKQRKIKEAKKKFADLKSNFETEKREHKNELKERAQSVVDKENALKEKEIEIRSKVKEFKNREKELEQTASENKAIRENLDKQVKIVAKKKEELDLANEERIRLLENIANLTEAEAKEQILDAVRAKAETDAMSIRKEVVQAAQITANKDAKKVVIQSIQRMCAEFTIENTVSVFPLESDDLKGQIIGRSSNRC
jgi:ribonuclease Y